MVRSLALLGLITSPMRAYHATGAPKLCTHGNFVNSIQLAMSPAEITDKLGLHRMRDRNWFVQPSCATSGDGLFEGKHISFHDR